jgi:hypothetical protein
MNESTHANIFAAIRRNGNGGEEMGWEPHSWPDPTNASPGSPEKIAVLQERINSGQQLFHPRDERVFSKINPTAPLKMVKLMGMGRPRSVAQ